MCHHVQNVMYGIKINQSIVNSKFYEKRVSNDYAIKWNAMSKSSGMQLYL